MGVRRFEDLIAWSLAHQLQQEVSAFTSTGRVQRDYKFRDQIRESARSVTRNTAEGFGRYYPREFARFLRIAAGSLHETKNHLRDALDRGYVSPECHEHLLRLTLRAIKANNRLTSYLVTCRRPEPSGHALVDSEPADDKSGAAFDSSPKPKNQP